MVFECTVPILDRFWIPILDFRFWILEPLSLRAAGPLQ
jgi:hypothetical protein